jgi:lipopolysaccharide transport system ATP-binding protein
VSENIIQVTNLAKCYPIVHKDEWAAGLRHSVENVVRNPLRWFRQSREQKELFWALKDVSFSVQAGEVIGVIGRNGAGKSTLLKILSRITEPTKGRVELNGRVASLLEVATGFHGDLTGRENIFLNGAILGMTKAEITRKFDEIVAFSEVGKFLDTPVKRYSSGMYMRLAFAVAAHLEPEILIVDEVLAVGDAAFQKKCLGKMQEVSRAQGRTVLFVSHNMSAVQQLTTRSVVMDKGTVKFFGPTEQAVEIYSSTAGAEAATFFDVDPLPRKLKFSNELRLTHFRFDRVTPYFEAGEDFSFLAKVRAFEDVPQFRVSLTISTIEGTPVGTCFGPERSGLKRGEDAELRITLKNPNLAPGRYSCDVAVGRGSHRTAMTDFDAVTDTLPFEVLPQEGEAGTVAAWHRNWGSVVFSDLAY